MNKKPPCPICKRRGGYVQLVGPPSRTAGATWDCYGCGTAWRRNSAHKGGLEILDPADLRTYPVESELPVDPYCEFGYFAYEHPKLCAVPEHLLPCGCPVGIATDEGHQEGCEHD